MENMLAERHICLFGRFKTPFIWTTFGREGPRVPPRCVQSWILDHLIWVPGPTLSLVKVTGVHLAEQYGSQITSDIGVVHLHGDAGMCY